MIPPPLPRKSIPANADTITRGCAIGLDQIKEAVWGIDGDRSGCFTRRIGDALATKFWINMPIGNAGDGMSITLKCRVTGVQRRVPHEALAKKPYSGEGPI